MSIFVIKVIACIAMVLDHVKYAIPATEGTITIYLGRIAFPLFAFLLTEGYVHTKNIKKYYKRLIIFALISQIPFMLMRTLVGEYMMFNILFTLILGLIAINVYDKIDKKYISIPLVMALIYLGKIINVDYGWYGVAMIVILYISRGSNILRVPSFILLNILYYFKLLITYYNLHIFTLFICSNLPIIIILLYNGKLGRKIKYFLYAFYPAHLAILYLINKLFF